MRRKSSSGKGNRKCEGPKEEVNLGCLRNKKGPLWSLAGQSEEHTTLRGGEFEPHVGIKITVKIKK